MYDGGWRMRLVAAVLIGIGTARAEGAADDRSFTVSISDDGRIDLGVVVTGLERVVNARAGSAKAAGADKAEVMAAAKVPIRGTAGALTLTFIKETLGSEVELAVRGDRLVVTVAATDLSGVVPRVRELRKEVERHARQSMHYGMHARESYRPNDPARRTVLLIHGINSTSGSFVHMVGPLEAAGFGVVVYDFPYNRRLRDSSDAFVRDWKAFRKETGDTRPWSVITHSMGALPAREYVEGPQYDGDVTHLVLIGPPNRGVVLAKAQVLLQLLEGVRGTKGRTNSVAALSDGLGESAADLMPGSAFLKRLDMRPRREGVSYHILAGDDGFLTRAQRARIELQFQAITRASSLLGGLAKMAAGDLAAQLDEVTEGTGDGVVSVASTRLYGVTDHVTIHANHVELIRGPLLYPDPGPVVGMPFVLDRLGRPGAKRPLPIRRRGFSAVRAAR